MKKIKKPKMIIDSDEYIRINKKLNREAELERNGGRWIAVNRPHKNKKKYDRKRDRKIDFYPFSFLSECFFYRNVFSNVDCTITFYVR